VADARADCDAVAMMRSMRAGSREPVERPVVDLTNVEPAELESTLLTLLAAHEEDGRPLVVDDAFAGLDDARRTIALDVLTWASDAVQVVYLESGRTVASRVRALGPQVASVIDLHEPSAPSDASVF